MAETLTRINNGLTTKVLLVTIGALFGGILQAVISNAMIGDKLDSIIRLEVQVTDLVRRVDTIETKLERP